MNAADPLQRMLQSAFDLWLADSPEARTECAALAGRSIAVELTDLRADLTLRPNAHGIAVTFEHAAAPDARIRATSSDLLRIVAARGAHGTPGRLHIEGDAEVAQRFRGMLRLVRFDPEERLAQLVGDVPAHQLGRLFRGVAAFGLETARTLGDMAGEYLHYENRALPTRAEVRGFVAAVDTLREDVDRAAARLDRVTPKAGA